MINNNNNNIDLQIIKILNYYDKSCIIWCHDKSDNKYLFYLFDQHNKKYLGITITDFWLDLFMKGNIDLRTLFEDSHEINNEPYLISIYQTDQFINAIVYTDILTDDMLPDYNTFYKPELIICSAIHYHDGNIYSQQPHNIISGIVVTGLRHSNCIIILASLLGVNYDNQLITQDSQGFLTSYNRFVSRKEAYQIKFGNNDNQSLDKKLYSEDLY